MKYIKSFTGLCSLSEIRAWHIGESEHLPKIIGTGFKETVFVSSDGIVEFYYDSKEVEEFEKALEQIGEKEFDEICTDFMIMIDKIPNYKNDEQKLLLFSKMIPALTIFYEFDNYSGYMVENMQRRLMRVRTHTETKPYELLKGVGKDDPKNFVHFRKETYPLEHRDKFLSKTL